MFRSKWHLLSSCMALVLFSQGCDVRIAPAPSKGASANQAPVAKTQSLATHEDVSLSVILSANDADSYPLTFKIVTPPAHGTLSPLSGANLSYTPASNFHGDDSFTFLANDGSLDSEPATITLTVSAVNDAPATPAGLSCATTPLAASTLNACTLVPAIPADPDGDTVTYVNDASTCSSVVVNSTTGAATFTAPLKNATCLVKIKAFDSVAYSNSVSASTSGANRTPTANTQTVSTNFNSAVALTLTGSDADSDALSYLVVSNPSHGTLSGSAPNLTYTPSEFYGSDSFTFKTNDGSVDSATATVTVTVSQPPTFYLSTSGLNGTAVVNDPTHPFRDAQNAYVAAAAYQLAHGGTVVISMGTGTFAGITLLADWNSSVHLIGAGSGLSNLGGILADGQNQNYYSTGIPDGVPNCNQNIIGLTFNSDECETWPAAYSVVVSGSGLSLGDINATNGTVADGIITNGSDRRQITLSGSLTANDITGNSKNFYELPAIVTLNAGTTARDIRVNSVANSGCGGNGCSPLDLIYGGTVNISGTARNIYARGSDNQIDGSGKGGAVNVLAGGVVGNIDVRGGGYTPAAVYGYDYLSNRMGAGGTVSIYGTAANVNADGGPNPTRASLGNLSSLNSGKGGLVTVYASGVAANISASGSATTGTNTNTPGGDGGTVVVSGIAQNIFANGTNSTDLPIVAADYWDCAGSGLNCVGGAYGGQGGSITVGASAHVANLEAKGGNFVAPIVESVVDYTYGSQAPNAYFGLGDNGAGGTIDVRNTATYGTLIYNRGTDGLNFGTVGSGVVH